MLIQTKQPAAALLDSDFTPYAQTFYGDTPVTLDSETQLQFTLTPEKQQIAGLRLRLGTFCRVNQCHLQIQIEQHPIQQFDVSAVEDNQDTDIIFDTPLRVKPHQALTIKLSSSDANKDNAIAVWCNTIPQFVDPFKSMRGWKRWFKRPEFKPLHLPAVDKPRVSIVIPVFNKVAYTYNCLLTVVETDPEVSKEVIILNNASSDETYAFLSQLQGGGFRVVNNQDNKGFVGACQQGGALATGEFILLLNNDTQVRTGYLSNMLAIFDQQSDVGIVGSKLIYPDGRLQEAGGIIFNDASGCNYGRLQDPGYPQFNGTREVDYCSGASLMIRTELWRHWGGFDPRYAPAYYEDTDLCFTARAKGYKVMYCPDSQVIHHEGITSGTDVTQGFKAYQVVNHKKFYQKWRAVLAKKHCSPITVPDKAALRLTSDYTVFTTPSQSEIKQTYELPIIFHYWSSRYLVPMQRELGFDTLEQLFIQTLVQQCQQLPTCYIAYLGSDNGQFEAHLIQQLQQQGFNNVVMHGLHYDAAKVSELNQWAQQQGLATQLQFQHLQPTIWQPEQAYHVILANHVLNGLGQLALVLDKLYNALDTDGKLVIADMIGQKGHQRDAAVLPHIPELWAQLPEHYRFNLLTQQHEHWFINHDYSHIGFEGVEAHTLLPLLIQRFGFERFLGYGNLIDVFIERGFGHHFDEHNPDDVAFIDQVQAIDQMLIEQGTIKPTHMIAVLQREQSIKPQVYRHLTPKFCI